MSEEPEVSAPEPPPEPRGVPAGMVDGFFLPIVALVAAKKTPDRADCPACHRPLFVRTGRLFPIRFFHDDTSCSLATAEGQKHLAARLALAAELPKRKALSCSRRCDACGVQMGRRELVPAYDEVRVALGGLPEQDGPDVTLLLAGETVLSLDVYLTMALEQRRGPLRAARGTPWLVVDRESALAYPTRAFLPTTFAEGPRPSWRCAPCEAKDAPPADVDRLARIAHGRALQESVWAVARDRFREGRVAERAAAEEAKRPKVCPYTAEQLRIAAARLVAPMPVMPFELPPMPPMPPRAPRPEVKASQQLLDRVRQLLGPDPRTIAFRDNGKRVHLPVQKPNEAQVAHMLGVEAFLARARTSWKKLPDGRIGPRGRATFAPPDEGQKEAPTPAAMPLQEARLRSGGKARGATPCPERGCAFGLPRAFCPVVSCKDPVGMGQCQEEESNLRSTSDTSIVDATSLGKQASPRRGITPNEDVSVSVRCPTSGARRLAGCLVDTSGIEPLIR